MTVMNGKKIYNFINEAYSKMKANTAKNLRKYEELEIFCKDRQRCFVIGNGPSLTAEDLDLLAEEVTFASNGFFNIYNGWTPTVYFCQDPTVLKNNLPKIKQYPARFKMINPHIKIKGSACKDAILYNVNRKNFIAGLPPYMTGDFSEGLCDGYTVTFSMLQMAVLLGFREIYLLGVDFNYIIKDGKIDPSSYPKNATNMMAGGLPNLDYNLLAFNVAGEYSKTHNIKIVNLSRQTKLEVFPRGDLNQIMETKAVL